jgi:hypothetical protein
MAQPDTAFCQGIELRIFDYLVPVNASVAITKIIGHHQNNIELNSSARNATDLENILFHDSNLRFSIFYSPKSMIASANAVPVFSKKAALPK